MNTFTHFENTVLNNITFEGYDLENEPTTNKEKVDALYLIFSSEYKGNHNKHLSDVNIFAEWLQGLPSSLSVPFYNYEILENAEMNGYKLDTEKQQDKFLAEYWLNLSNAYFILKENL